MKSWEALEVAGRGCEGIRDPGPRGSKRPHIWLSGWMAGLLVTVIECEYKVVAQPHIGGALSSHTQFGSRGFDQHGPIHSQGTSTAEEQPHVIS